MAVFGSNSKVLSTVPLDNQFIKGAIEVDESGGHIADSAIIINHRIHPSVANRNQKSGVTMETTDHTAGRGIPRVVPEIFESFSTVAVVKYAAVSCWR
jgi:hypothetical protein